MFCRKCGNEMMDGDRYCLRCGHDQTVSGGQNQTGSIFDSNNNNYSNHYVNSGKSSMSGCLTAIVVFVIIGFVFIGGFIMLGSLGNNVQNMFEEASQATVETGGVPTQNSSKENKSNIPIEYISALGSAQIYVDNMYMSKRGLYEQLISPYGEKFSEDAAQYAVSNVKANWKENAYITAKNYRNTMHMSKQAIYEQLISPYGEKFTEEEAKYAVGKLAD